MDVAMPELIAADINQALLHDTNPWNSEYHWRIVWTESFFSTRSIALVPSLRIAPEYHLIQRGITREQSPVLRIKNKVPPQHSDTELSEGELTDYEGTLADSFLDNNSVREIKTRKPKSDGNFKGKSTSDEFTVQTRSLTYSLRAPPGPAFTPRPRTPPNSIIPIGNKTPGSTETQPVKQSKDSSFRVDCAMVAYSSNPRPSRVTFDFRTTRHSTNVPIIHEIKSVPTRGLEFEPAIESSNFRKQLDYFLGRAYKDINLKTNAVFHFHERQKSLIGIASSGPWWSFTLVRKGDEETEWSRAFVLGHKQHDGILTLLFKAAAESPHDPIDFKEGSLLQWFKTHSRQIYDGTDVLSWHPFRDIGYEEVLPPM